MAKTRATKVTINTTSAVKSIKNLTDTVSDYNAVIKATIIASGKQNTAANVAKERFQDLNKAVGGTTRSLGFLRTRIAETKDETIKQSRAIKTSTGTILEFRDVIKSLTAPLEASAKRLDALRVAADKEARSVQSNTKALKVNRDHLDTLGNKLKTVSAAYNGYNSGVQTSTAIINQNTQALKRNRDHLDTLGNRLKPLIRTWNGYNNGLSTGTAALASNASAIKSNISVEERLGSHTARNARLQQEAAAADKKRTASLRTTTTATHAARKSTIAFSLSLSNMIRIGLGLLFHRLFLRLTQAIIQSVSAAKDWAKAVSEIRTISDRAAVSTQQWRSELIQISDAFGTGFLETAEAGYQALSNQVVNAADTFAFLRQEVQLSLVTVSSLDDSVKATTAIINAFHLETSEASRVNAVLFKTVEEGRIRLGELADTIGRVSIVSAQLGVSYTEQSASLTLLTRQGIKAEEAITLLRNVELKLIKPTDAMKNLFEEWGVTSGESAIKTFGLTGVLAKLGERAKGSGDAAKELGEIFGRLRAIVGAAALTQNDFNAEMEKFEKASQSAFDAFEERLNSMDTRANQQLARLKNSITEVFGQRLLELLVTNAEALGGADVALVRLLINLRKGITLFATFVVAMKTTALIRYGVGLTALGVRFGIVSAAASTAAASVAVFNLAVGGLALGIGLVAHEILTAKARLFEINAALETAAASAATTASAFGSFELARFNITLDEAAQKTELTILRMTGSIARLLAALRRENTRITASIETEWIAAANLIEKTFDKSLKTLRGSLKEARKEAEEAAAKAKEGAADVIKASREEVIRQDTAAAIAHVSAIDNINALNELRKSLNRTAFTAQKAGQQEIFKFYAAEADKVRDLQLAALEKLRDASAKEVSVDAGVRIKRDKVTGAPIIDPKTGRAKLERFKTKEKTNPAAEKLALEGLLDLDKARTATVSKRILLQEAFFKKEAARTKIELAAIKTREDAAEKFAELLAEIDSFDITKADVAKGEALRDKIESGRGLARKAGFSEAEITTFLRESTKLLQLQVQQLQEGLSDKFIKSATENLKKLTTSIDAATKAYEDSTNKFVAFAKTGGVVDLTKSVTLLRDAAKLTLRNQLQANARELAASVNNLGGLDLSIDLKKNTLTAEALFKATQKVLDLITKAQAAQGTENQVQALKALAASKKDLVAATVAFNKSSVNRIKDLGIFFQQNFQRDKEGNILLTKDKSFIQVLAVAEKEFSDINKALKGREGANKLLLDFNTQMLQMRANLLELSPELTAFGINLKDIFSDANDDIVDTDKVWKELLKSMKEAAKLQRSLLGRRGGGRSIPTLPGESHGGKLNPGYYSHGGNSRGIDMFPAMLARDEIVMTQSVSRAMAPYLHAANAAPPQYRSQGGTAVNFGDVNITMPAGTTGVQMDSFVSELQRRVRLGTFSLN